MAVHTLSLFHSLLRGRVRGGGRCLGHSFHATMDPHPARLRFAAAGDPPRKGEGKAPSTRLD